MNADENSEESIPEIGIDCKLHSNSIMDRKSSRVWPKNMMPEYLQGQFGFMPPQIEQRGTAIDGEVYNIDPALELVAGDLHK